MERRITTQDITWFLDTYKSEQLNLTPSYQRRSVWTRKDKLFYLDTIFKGYPCPAIFLHKEINGETGSATYHVVDGKQRLETILTFAQNKLSLPKDHQIEELQGCKFKDLSTEYKKKFWNYVISVDQLDIVEESVVDEVFDRLNRNSRKLERQELRHAKFDGWFINFAEEESTVKEWKDLGIATTSRAKRMKDVQFLSELMIATIESSYQGFSQDDLDEFCAYYDLPEEDKPDFIVDDFEVKFRSIRDLILSCEQHNQCVSKYARNFMHFYSLWCLTSVKMHEIPAAEIANRYAAFMEQYREVNVTNDIQDETLPHVKYALNSVGANTELPQRKSRHEALLEAL